jgi:hypothetical protein
VEETRWASCTLGETTVLLHKKDSLVLRIYDGYALLLFHTLNYASYIMIVWGYTANSDVCACMFTLDSGVDRFKRQFAHLEEGGAKGEKSSPQLRQNASLPRQYAFTET